jgi:putative holliday junction resolvase
MRIMAFDVGDKTIGVAVSDLMGWTAQGVEVIRRSSWQNDLDRINQLVQTYEVEEFVVGLPLNMNGTEGPRAELSRRFGEKLQSISALPIHFWDERLTTVAAERVLLEADMSRQKRKQKIDQVAATFILQNFLDARANRKGV